MGMCVYINVCIYLHAYMRVYIYMCMYECVYINVIVLATTPHKTPTIRTLAPPSRKLYKLDEPDTRDTGEARTSS